MRSDPSKDAVAARLKEARERLFHSAADAARALSMKPVTVRAHESGQNSPSYYDLEKYARRYGVSVSWLMTGEGEQAPEATVDQHAHYGHAMFVHSLVEDGVWLPAQPDDAMIPSRTPIAPDGDAEFVVYTDPRFPPEMVTAFKVVTQKTTGEYLNGSIVYALPVEMVGYREGDHVLVASRRGEFYEWSLRLVVPGDDGVEFEALTSDSPRLRWRDDEEIETRAVGIVVASETRRPVPPLELRERQEFELAEALVDGRRMRLPKPITRDEEHEILLSGVKKRAYSALP